MSVATNIASWGNSEAVRIPKSLLRSVGLSAGDSVRIATTERGVIEIAPIRREHRRVQPKRGITFDSLFEGYEPARQNTAAPWPTDDMLGTELEAWS